MNLSSLRGRKRMTRQSMYDLGVMVRALAQVPPEADSEHGVHVANMVIDGLIDSPDPEPCREPSGARKG